MTKSSDDKEDQDRRPEENAYCPVGAERMQGEHDIRECRTAKSGHPAEQSLVEHQDVLARPTVREGSYPDDEYKAGRGEPIPTRRVQRSRQRGSLARGPPSAAGPGNRQRAATGRLR